ncbi:MAG: Flp pilus assembly protein CpaB [Acidobacteria bacterium]|nr:MAG: Flp pilus assembly protein CpaB [Acidobacteriota bacterium]
MTRIRVFIVLVLAITAGGAFALGTYNYVQNLPTQTTTIPTKPVVVAASDLDVGAELSKDNIRIIQWPANAVPTNVISDPKDVIGRGLILPMIQNEPFLPMKLASAEAGAGLPPAIPPGLRALSIKVNEVIGVAGYVLPGTRVDVLVTVSPGQGGQGDVTSKVILTNVQVVAAGTKIDRETDKNKPMAVTVVTVLVTPEESERLTLASTEGKIQLALRNPLDKATPLTRGIRQSALLGVPATTPRATVRVAAAAKPLPLPLDAATVEIIRGDKRAREAVRQE